MNREAWAMFLGLAMATAVGVLAVGLWKKQQELASVRAQVEETRRMVEQKNAHLAEASHALQLERNRAETLMRDFAVITNTQQRLEAEMRAAVESRDIAISELQGKLTVTIVDRILFDSGDATLKPEGMKVLDQVAQVLGRFTNRQVQVFGHTDNVPIRIRFPSNWELSTARAVAAVRYLTETAGVDPRRLSAVGCGEFQPIGDNTTPEGRSKNRRIALVILPEQFVPTDVSPLATNAAPSALTQGVDGSAPGSAPAASTNVISTDLPTADPGSGGAPSMDPGVLVPLPEAVPIEAPPSAATPIPEATPAPDAVPAASGSVESRTNAAPSGP